MICRLLNACKTYIWSPASTLMALFLHKTYEQEMCAVRELYGQPTTTPCRIQEFQNGGGGGGSRGGAGESAEREKKGKLGNLRGNQRGQKGN